MLVLRSLLFIFLLQFFRKSLSLRDSSPRLDKVFISGILFYVFMVVLNLYSTMSFPGPLYLDLIANPPDRAGPGLVKLQYLVLPFIVLLLTSAILSFLAWRRGSSYAKYLCISFMLPLMTVSCGPFNNLVLRIYLVHNANCYLGWRPVILGNVHSPLVLP